MKELEAMRRAYAEKVTPTTKKLVHYSVEKVSHDVVSGVKTSHPEICKTGVKLFDDVKRNLELQGYTVCILWHPLGKYNVPMGIETKTETLESMVAAKGSEIMAKDAEIERLKAELALAKANLATKKETAPKGESKGKGGKKATKEVETKVEEEK